MTHGRRALNRRWAMTARRSDGEQADTVRSAVRTEAVIHATDKPTETKRCFHKSAHEVFTPPREGIARGSTRLRV